MGQNCEHNVLKINVPIFLQIDSRVPNSFRGQEVKSKVKVTQC